MKTKAKITRKDTREHLVQLPELPELPYWETINDYLKRLDPSQLQGVVCGLVRRLLRSRVFEDSRIRENTGR